MKRSCNQCGDYEYCAFDFEKCTGFIPGELYNEESKMTEVSVLEYIQYEEEFFRKHGEYSDKLKEINKKERLGELDEDTAALQRESLKKEYGEYIDVFLSTKYCIISESLKTAYKATGNDTSGNFEQFLDEQKKYAGKYVTMSSGLSGILVGIGVALDDFYYIIKEEGTDKLIFDTGVDGIETCE